MASESYLAGTVAGESHSLWTTLRALVKAPLEKRTSEGAPEQLKVSVARNYTGRDRRPTFPVSLADAVDVLAFRNWCQKSGGGHTSVPTAKQRARQSDCTLPEMRSVTIHCCPADCCVAISAGLAPVEQPRLRVVVPRACIVRVPAS